MQNLRLSPDLQSAVLFLVGIVLLVREVAFEPRPIDPTLLLFYGGMIGLAPVLHRDRRQNGNGGTA